MSLDADGRKTWAQVELPDVEAWPYFLALHTVLMFFGGNTNNSMEMTIEKILGSFTMLSGTILTAVIVSQVSVLMASLQASERQYVNKLSHVNVTMEKLSVPRKLRSRVMDYYSYLWDRYGTFDVRNNFNLSSELSSPLNSEISLFFHRRMVTHVPIFRYSTPRVVQAVVTCLVPEIYVAGDFIVRAGSRNSAMYFIRDGRCSVLLDDDKSDGVMHRVNVLRRNTHFGELSLFSDSHMATAHILADTNVDVHALYKADFERIRRDFPELLADLLLVVERSAYGTQNGSKLNQVNKALNSVQMQLTRYTKCSSDTVQAIVDSCVQVRFSRGDYMVTMGERSLGLYFLIEGTAAVGVPSLHSDDIDDVGELVAGELFGELSLVHDVPATAHVIASSDIVQCQVLFREEYEVLKLSHPDLPQCMRTNQRQHKYERLSPFLRRPTFFVGLSVDLTRAILGALHSTSFSPDAPLLRRGRGAHKLLFVLRGEAVACLPLTSIGLQPEETHYFLFEPTPHPWDSASPEVVAEDINGELSFNNGARLSNPSSPTTRVPVRSGSQPPQLSRQLSGGQHIYDCLDEASCDGTAAKARGRASETHDVPAALHHRPDGSRPRRLSSDMDVDARSFTAALGNDDEAEIGTAKEVMVFREGDVIGEECLMRPGSIAAMDVRAARDGCDTCSLSFTSFTRLVEGYPEFYRFIEERNATHLSGFSKLSICAFLSTTTSLFEEADLALVEAVAEGLSVISCEPGQHLIRRGTSAPGLFFVHSGECHCLVPDPEKPEEMKNVATKVPGQHFGELSLLDPSNPTAADVVASNAAVVLLLTPESFKSINRTHESFKVLLLSTMPSYRTYNLFFHMPIFHDAAHEFLLALVKAVHSVKFEADTIVQRMTDPAKGAYFVVEGQLLATAPRSKPLTLRESDLFGFETLVDIGDAETRAMQQVQAGTDVDLLCLPREEAMQLVELFPYLRDCAQARKLSLSQQMDRGGAIDDSLADLSSSLAGTTASDGAASGPLDTELLSQRLGLMQASIVAIGREMRSRVDRMDNVVQDFMERSDRQHTDTMRDMKSRLDQLANAHDHPQRNPRASKVAFAPPPRSNTSSDPSRRADAPADRSDSQSSAPSALSARRPSMGRIEAGPGG